MTQTGKDLAALRRRAGMSQASLAQRVGISRQTVSYWEGKPALDGRAATLTKIACALDPSGGEVILNSRPAWASSPCISRGWSCRNISA